MILTSVAFNIFVVQKFDNKYCDKLCDDDGILMMVYMFTSNNVLNFEALIRTKQYYSFRQRLASDDISISNTLYNNQTCRLKLCSLESRYI